MRKLARGESAALNVTPQAQHRVFAGLGWEPVARPGMLERIKAMTGGAKLHHDLDLACYIYDRGGRYIGHVSAQDGQHTDQTGQIYHSGDNVEGLGDGDDEQISVELKDLDPAIANIIFKASIKSGHTFALVREPEIHIADGYSGHSFLRHDLSQGPGNDKDAYVFARLYRTPEGAWMIQNIGDFIARAPAPEWPEILRAYTRI